MGSRGVKSALLILHKTKGLNWRKSHQLEINTGHLGTWDILRARRGGRLLLETDIYKPLVIDQVIVLRHDYKGSVEAGWWVCLLCDWSVGTGHNGHTRTKRTDTGETIIRTITRPHYLHPFVLPENILLQLSLKDPMKSLWNLRNPGISPTANTLFKLIYFCSLD